jgi:hypothetical protein
MPSTPFAPGLLRRMVIAQHRTAIPVATSARMLTARDGLRQGADYDALAVPVTETCGGGQELHGRPTVVRLARLVRRPVPGFADIGTSDPAD